MINQVFLQKGETKEICLVSYICKRYSTKPMNKRKGILEFLNTCNNDSSYCLEISCSEDISKLVEYLCVFFHDHFFLKDFEEGRTINHQERYETLYFGDMRLTYTEAALELYIPNGTTLKQWARKHNQAAYLYLEKRSETDRLYKDLLMIYLQHEFYSS